MITIASIVEREAAVGSERPIIASVYLNRFHGGGPLGADPTVQYAVGNSSNWWPVLSSKDLDVDNAYNTYKNDGLPPTPIANPGLPSILAVLKPADTNYLYFVAKNDGSQEHAFEETATEHDADVAKYRDGSGGGSGNDSGNGSTQIQPISNSSGG